MLHMYTYPDSFATRSRYRSWMSKDNVVSFFCSSRLTRASSSGFKLVSSLFISDTGLLSQNLQS